MAGNFDPSELLALTRNIVVAHVANANIAAGDIASLLRSVYAALASAASGGPAAERPRPALPVNKSVTRNHIICLEDGKKLGMLRRYLRPRYRMSPEQYRKQWGLASARGAAGGEHGWASGAVGSLPDGGRFECDQGSIGRGR